jgi:polyisoprenoid-binding protein YceI
MLAEMLRLALGSVAVAWALGAAVRAEERMLHVDPAASRVTFTLQATLHQVEGSFSVRSGEVRFDAATGGASGEIVVAAASGETGNARRDRKMHAEVLESARWPELTFTPARIAGGLAPQGESEVTVRGVLRLQGQPHEVEVPLAIQIEANRLRAEGSLSVPYVAWGLADPSSLVLRVGKTVEVRILISGTLAARGVDASTPHPPQDPS